MEGPIPYASRKGPRLSTMPPEFWTPNDWITSRRLRHQREVAIRNAARKGRNPANVAQQYPEGLFWPRTPRRNQDMVNALNASRILWQIEDVVGPDVDIFVDGNGTVWAEDPDIGMYVRTRVAVAT